MLVSRLLPLAGIGLLIAACAETQPPPGPVGLAAEGFPPQQASPEGLLGDAEVGPDSLADPGIATLGQPLP